MKEYYALSSVPKGQLGTQGCITEGPYLQGDERNMQRNDLNCHWHPQSKKYLQGT